MIVGTVRQDGANSVPYADYAAQDGAFELTADQREVLEKTAKAHKLLTEHKPTFQIRTMFKAVSQRQPYLGIVTVWNNAASDGYVGAQMVYFCTKKVEKQGEMRVCSAPIPPALLSNRVAVCPECRQPSAPEELCGQIMGRFTLSGWAQMLSRLFFALGCDADLSVMMEDGSLHEATDKEHERVHNGDVLNRVRASRRMVVYSLARIVQDTTNGSGVLARFKAFLSA